MGEEVLRAAHLPDSVVAAVQVLLDVVEQGQLQRPGEVVFGDPELPRALEREHDLAEDIALELEVGGVADPHRRSALIPGQLRHHPLRQPSLARRCRT